MIQNIWWPQKMFFFFFLKIQQLTYQKKKLNHNHIVTIQNEISLTLQREGEGRLGEILVKFQG